MPSRSSWPSLSDRVEAALPQRRRPPGAIAQVEHDRGNQESAHHERVEQHAELAGSPIAAALLKDWTAALRRFVKVMPDDYARVLAERDAEAAIAGD